MAIKDLKVGEGKVDVIFDVVEKGDIREFQKFGKTGKVCTAKVKDESEEMVSIVLEFEDAVVERLEKVSTQPKYKDAFAKACEKVNAATRAILQEALDSCYNISDKISVQEKTASVKTAGVLEDIIAWGKDLAKKFVEAFGAINQGQAELESLTTDLLAA